MKKAYIACGISSKQQGIEYFLWSSSRKNLPNLGSELNTLLYQCTQSLSKTYCNETVKILDERTLKGTWGKNIITYKGIPVELSLELGRNPADQERVELDSPSVERKNASKYTVSGKIILQLSKRNNLPRKTKAETIHHH